MRFGHPRSCVAAAVATTLVLSCATRASEKATQDFFETCPEALQLPDWADTGGRPLINFTRAPVQYASISVSGGVGSSSREVPLSPSSPELPSVSRQQWRNIAVVTGFKYRSTSPRIIWLALSHSRVYDSGVVQIVQHKLIDETRVPVSRFLRSKYQEVMRINSHVGKKGVLFFPNAKAEEASEAKMANFLSLALGQAYQKLIKASADAVQLARWREPPDRATVNETRPGATVDEPYVHMFRFQPLKARPQPYVIPIVAEIQRPGVIYGFLLNDIGTCLAATRIRAVQ